MCFVMALSLGEHLNLNTETLQDDSDVNFKNDVLLAPLEFWCILKEIYRYF